MKEVGGNTNHGRKNINLAYPKLLHQMNNKIYLLGGLLLLFSCKNKKIKPLAPEVAAQVRNLYESSASRYDSDPDKAMEYGQQLLRLGRSIGDSETVGKGFTNVATVHYIKGDYPAALDTFQMALDIDNEFSKDLNFKKSKAAHYNNIGNIYKSLENFDTALQRYQTAYHLARAGDSEALKTKSDSVIVKAFDTVLCNASMNLGYIYEKRAGEIKTSKDTFAILIDSAFKYEKLALSLSVILKHRKNLNIIYNNLGKIHRLIGNTDSAILFFNRAIDSSQLVKDIRGRGESHIFLAELYDTLRLYDSAIVNGRKGLQDAVNSSYMRGILMAYSVLAHAFDAMGIKDSALVYYKSKDQAYRSLFNINKVQQVQFSAIEYRNREIEKAKRDREEKERNYRRAGIFVVIFVFAFVGVILLLKMKKHVRNATLEKVALAFILLLLEFIHQLNQPIIEHSLDKPQSDFFLAIKVVLLFIIAFAIAYFLFNPAHKWLDHWIKSKFSVEKKSSNKTRSIRSK